MGALRTPADESPFFTAGCERGSSTSRLSPWMRRSRWWPRRRAWKLTSGPSQRRVKRVGLPACSMRRKGFSSRLPTLSSGWDWAAKRAATGEMGVPRPCRVSLSWDRKASPSTSRARASGSSGAFSAGRFAAIQSVETRPCRKSG